MAGKRVNNAELERRITRAYEMLLEVKSSGTIVQTISAETGVTERQAYDYLAAARKRLVEQYRVKREEMAAAQLLKLEALAELATRDRQYSAAVGAMAAANRMMSLDPGK